MGFTRLKWVPRAFAPLSVPYTEQYKLSAMKIDTVKFELQPCFRTFIMNKERKLLSCKSILEHHISSTKQDNKTNTMLNGRTPVPTFGIGMLTLDEKAIRGHVKLFILFYTPCTLKQFVKITKQ